MCRRHGPILRCVLGHCNPRHRAVVRAGDGRSRGPSQHRRRHGPHGQTRRRRIGRDRRHGRKARFDRPGDADRHDGLERRRSAEQNIASIRRTSSAPSPVSRFARRVRARPNTRCAAWPPPAAPWPPSASTLMRRPCRRPQWRSTAARSSMPTSTISITSEMLRGPQGTLYGAGSMGGTIKLVTNPPKLGTFEGAADVDTSHTTGGSTNGGGSVMVNLPIGDIAALRFGQTEKYISGWIHRCVDRARRSFRFPRISAHCGAQCVYYCTRGDVQDAPVAKTQGKSNMERFISSRASLLVNRATLCRSPGTHVPAHQRRRLQQLPGAAQQRIAMYQPTI